MSPDRAEELALRALAHIAGSEELGPQFIGATGIDPGHLMRAAGDTDTLLAVLDFLTQRDVWISAFCEGSGYAPTDPLLARAVLSGTAGMHWT